MLRELFYKAITWGACLALCSCAVMPRKTVKEPGMTLSEARKIADEVAPELTIPIRVDEAVLAHLNELTRTKGGKKRMSKGLAQFEKMRPMLEKKFRERHMPFELMAIALSESNFNTRAISPGGAAGIWQFMPATARHYGLAVSRGRDGRLDPAKATDAALAYFSELKRNLGNWLLAIKAYNQGEASVKKQIEKHPNASAWELPQGRDKGYLSRAVAMMIIMKRPDLIAR